MTEFKNKTILVVDDSPADLQLTINIIKEHYKVLGAKSGEQALDIIPKAKVDIVLLDVNMPGIDGYNTCQQIKALENPPVVIFVSANDSTEEITKGYEVGGEDYLVKPYSTALLLNKIVSTLKLTDKIGLLVETVDQASNIALSAMSSSGELSIVVNTLRSSFSISTLDELGMLATETLEQYGLTGTVQLRTEYSNNNYSTNAEISPLEAELLNRIADMQERIFAKDARLFLNQGKVSFLIKNIPIVDEDLSGRLRDYLAMVIEGVNEKCIALGNEQQVKAERNDTVTKLIKEADVSLTYALDTQLSLEQGNVGVLDKLQESIETAFLNLGLSDTQEREILSLLGTAEQESAQLFEKSINVSQELKSVVTKFNLLKV